MPTLKKFSQTGEAIGEIEVDDSLANAEARGQSVKDYLVALRHNKRQWSACTKTRAEVKHTTAKPFRQKGTGNARHGSLVAPQYRGGGIVFGPRPKFNVNIRINKKERRQAIRALLGEKIREGKCAVIESTEMESPRTKQVMQFLEKASQRRRVLFLGESQWTSIETEGVVQTVALQQTRHRNFWKSVRNIPKTAFAFASAISGYDVVLADEIFVTEQALKEVTQWLCGTGGKR